MKRAWFVMGLMVVGCSSADSSVPVSVLVENTTCSETDCAPVAVLAYPDNQPNTPGGAWTIPLGTLTTRFGCFTIPASAKFQVSSNGVVEQEFRWTTNDRIAIGSGLGLHPTLHTPLFVPAAAMGWKVTFPGMADAIPTAACTPS